MWDKQKEISTESAHPRSFLGCRDQPNDVLKEWSVKGRFKTVVVGGRIIGVRGSVVHGDVLQCLVGIRVG